MIITIQIDTATAASSNPKDLAVLAALADVLSQGVTVTSKKTKTPGATMTTAATAAEEEAPEETKEETKTDKADKDDSGSKVTIKQLRELVSDKVTKHRDTIREKLEEFGAKNTSSLDPEHFDVFFAFLNKLK